MNYDILDKKLIDFQKFLNNEYEDNKENNTYDKGYTIAFERAGENFCALRQELFRINYKEKLNSKSRNVFKRILNTIKNK